MLGTSLVAVTYDRTKERIEENQRQLLMAQLNLLIPADSIDNDLLSDVITVRVSRTLNNQSIQVYRARKDGQPVAALFSPVIANGYMGSIRLIVAVRYDGTPGRCSSDVA